MCYFYPNSPAVSPEIRDASPANRQRISRTNGIQLLSLPLVQVTNENSSPAFIERRFLFHVFLFRCAFLYSTHLQAQARKLIWKIRVQQDIGNLLLLISSGEGTVQYYVDALSRT